MKQKIVLGCVALGLILGQIGFRLYEAGVFVDWEALGSPPDGAIEILGSGGDNVFVKSNNGKSYTCDISPQLPCWVEANWPEDEPFSMGRPVSKDIFWIINTPSNIIDSFAVVGFAFEHTAEAKYVITADGNVWRWHYAVPAMGFQSLFFHCFGAVLGLLIGFILISSVQIVHDRAENEIYSTIQDKHLN